MKGAECDKCGSWEKKYEKRNDRIREAENYLMGYLGISRRKANEVANELYDIDQKMREKYGK